MIELNNLPPLRDIPANSVALRRRHLLDEIGRRRFHKLPRRRLRPLPALAVVLAAAVVIVAPAFALSKTVQHFFGFEPHLYAIDPHASLPFTNKDEATLTSQIDTDAPAGTDITVTFTVTPAGQPNNFCCGGQGVFVRLLSRSGADATMAMATDANSDSHYRATVRVPDGGIKDIQVGIEGWAVHFSNGTTDPAPVLFPITNDPFNP
jgi:hypothetical protein